MKLLRAERSKKTGSSFKCIDIEGEEIKSINEIFAKRKKLNIPSLVYFLLHKNEIVYIGQSKVGLSRLYQHIRDKIFDSYCYFLVDESKLDRVEMMNILHYKPLYNKDRFCNKDKTLISVAGIFVEKNFKEMFYDKDFRRKVVKKIYNIVKNNNLFFKKKVLASGRTANLLYKKDIDFVITSLEIEIDYFKTLILDSIF